MLNFYPLVYRKTQKSYDHCLGSTKMTPLDFEENKQKLLKFLSSTPFWKGKISHWDALPITDYTFYEKALKDHFDSKISPLNHQKINFWGQTSGTLGREKYFPYTKRFVQGMQVSSEAFVHSILKKLGRFHLRKFLVLAAANPGKTTKSGVRIGFSSSFQAQNVSLVTRMLHSVPSKIFLNDDVFNQWIYFISFVSDPDVLISVTPHKIDLVLKTIKENLNLYKHMVKEAVYKSALPLSVSNERKQYLFSLTEDEITYNTLWPNLKAICCWKNSICEEAAKNIEEQFQGEVFDSIYASTESQIAIPFADKSLPGSLLYLNDQVLEFHPIGQKITKENLLSPFELEEGKSYEIFISNTMGLLRYRLEDRLLCKGYFNNMPLVQFEEKDKATIILTHSFVSSKLLVKASKRLNFITKKPYLFTPNKAFDGLELFLSPEDYKDLHCLKKASQFDHVLSEVSEDYRLDLKAKILKPLVIKVFPESADFKTPEHFQSKVNISQNMPL